MSPTAMPSLMMILIHFIAGGLYTKHCVWHGLNPGWTELSDLLVLLLPLRPRSFHLRPLRTVAAFPETLQSHIRAVMHLHQRFESDDAQDIAHLLVDT